MNQIFIFNSIMLGTGLAMDAFSVSVANGLAEPGMRKRRMCAIAGVFASFQALMPMTGWICVHTIVLYFKAFEKSIPYIALILLAFIGIKMIIEGVRGGNDDEISKIGKSTLLIQGVATSIDALSVGFAIADYDLTMALICAAIIATVTFIICMFGLVIGRRFGTKLSGKADIIGGIILVLIGIEIFFTGIF
ncbi:MAG: manganese efflux pump [Lachnospiraceae bacterium]|nr:manganese efflux pump [Lachnospiraceae bacterium]